LPNLAETGSLGALAAAFGFEMSPFLSFKSEARSGKGLTSGTLANRQWAGLSLAARLALLAVCVAGSAEAADLPNLKEPPVAPLAPVPAFSWTGLYVGVNGGVGLDHFGVPSNIWLPSSPLPIVSFTGIISTGPVLGGQIGYNYEITNLPLIGHAVVGVEVDSDWADVTGRNTVGTAIGPATFGTRFENFGTARLRVGYNFDRLLVYVTGGLTYGSFNSYYNVAGFSGSQNVSYARLPPTSQAMGIGAEYALTNNLSVKAEYLYDGILSQWDQVASTPPGLNVGFTTRADYSIIRLGLNYKLDLFSPPASRY